MTPVTPQQTLIEIRLGGDLAGFIQRERAKGRGWRPIAAELSERSRIPVSHETVRQWHRTFTEPETSAA